MKTANTRVLGYSRARLFAFGFPKGYSIPHMGWNQLIIRNRPPILEGIAEGTHFYFVHSYYVVPQDTNIVATDTDYGGPFLLDGMAQKRVRHPIPPRKKPIGRPANSEKFRGIINSHTGWKLLICFPISNLSYLSHSGPLVDREFLCHIACFVIIGVNRVEPKTRGNLAGD